MFYFYVLLNTYILITLTRVQTQLNPDSGVGVCHVERKFNMKKIAFFGLSAFALTAALASAQSSAWKIVTDDRFSVMIVENKTDIENFTGRTSKVSGTLNFDRNAKTGSGTIMIDGASIDTGVALRNEHMRSADWFNFDKDSMIKFVTTSVRNTRGDTYSVTGDLSMKGITKRVTTTATLKYTAASEVTKSMGFGGNVVALSTKFKVKLSDFGVKHPAIGAGRVSDSLDVSINVVATDK
jgi:polyisoprenoid-binding protein YceI